MRDKMIWNKSRDYIYNNNENKNLVDQKKKFNSIKQSIYLNLLLILFSR